MAIRAAKLLVEIGADISKLTKGLKDSESLLGKFGTGALQAGGVMTAGLTTAALAAGRAIFDVGAALEQSQVAFATMLGSAEQAGKYLTELQGFASRTPFEFAELQVAARRMLAFGFEAGRVIPMLTDIGDAAAGLGLGADGVNRVTLALGQMQAKGKISADEMLQLTEAGIPAWRYLAEAMGMSTAEVLKLSERGLIPAGQAIEALLAGMREDFGGLMAQQAGTASGQISNLRDELYALGTGLAEFVLPAAKEFIGGGRELVGVFNELPDGTKRAVLQLGVFAAAIGPASGAIGGLLRIAPGAIRFGRDFGAALALIKGAGLAETLSVAGLGAGGLAAALTPLVAVVGAVAGVWAAWNEHIEKTNREGKKAVQTAWGDFLQKQVADGKNATQVLAEYQAAQQRVADGLRIDWGRISPMALLKGDWENFAKLFVKNKGELVNAGEELGLTIARTSTSYSEYVGVMQQAGLEMGNQAAFGALMAGGYATMAEMARTAAAGIAEVGDASGPAMEALASAGAAGIESLRGLVATQGELRTQMEAWTNDVAGKAVQGLNNMNVESDKYLNGLRAVDEVMGTQYYSQQVLVNGLTSLGEQYRRTGDLEAYKTGLEKIKKEGLETLQKGLEDVTLRAQALYDKLLALPKEIQIRVGFDVGEFPSFSGGSGIGAAERSANYDINGNGIIGQATGGDWLVTKPTLFLAGEAGPERATFTPLKKGLDPWAGESGQPTAVVYATVNNQVDVARLAMDVANEIRRRRL